MITNNSEQTCFPEFLPYQEMESPEISSLADPIMEHSLGLERLRSPLDASVIPLTCPELPFPPATSTAPGSTLDAYTLRKDFPILREKIHGKDLVWFDNAATTQKPAKVIERLQYFYEHENSNVHRGAHTLAARTTDAFEGARNKVASYLNTKPEEILFVRGTTEGINLVAQSYGMNNLKQGDEIILTLLEHHANIIPWQMIRAKTGAVLRIVPVDDKGQILMDEYKRLLCERTKIVACTHVSNALGTITPIKDIISMAHQWGARVLVDGAQAIAHVKADMKALDCDFYVFSGHKFYAPTGIGVVYGKAELLEAMPPYQGGGNMIENVTFEKSLFKAPPHRFEAGTANIADAIGLGAVIEYVCSIGIEAIFNHEHRLLEHARACLDSLPGLKIIGNAEEAASIVSFVLDGFTPDEIGKALDKEGIAVRTGHHCSQPILRRFGQESTVRASFAMYNTLEEIDYFVSVLKKIIRS